MRKKWVQEPGTGKLIPVEEYRRKQVEAHYIMPDIQPYQSMIDGTMISSRSHHRAHLKAHGCVEVGNETKHLKSFGRYEPPTGLKEELIRVANNLKRK